MPMSSKGSFLHGRNLLTAMGCGQKQGSIALRPRIDGCAREAGVCRHMCGRRGLGCQFFSRCFCSASPQPPIWRSLHGLLLPGALDHFRLALLPPGTGGAKFPFPTAGARAAPRQHQRGEVSPPGPLCLGTCSAEWERDAGGSRSFSPGTCRAWRSLSLRCCSGRPPNSRSRAASTRTTGEQLLFRSGRDTASLRAPGRGAWLA